MGFWEVFRRVWCRATSFSRFGVVIRFRGLVLFRGGGVRICVGFVCEFRFFSGSSRVEGVGLLC